MSTENSQHGVAFSCLFLTAKNVEVLPGAGCAPQDTNTRRSQSHRRFNMLMKGACAEERKWTRSFWFSSEVVDSLDRNLQSPQSEMFSFLFSCFLSVHRQQCNDTTYTLLAAFCCKKFAITTYTWGSFREEMLFFLLLFARNCRFPRCSNSKLSLSIHSVVQNKNVGRVMNTHLRRRSYAPRQMAP